MGETLMHRWVYNFLYFLDYDCVYDWYIYISIWTVQKWIRFKRNICKIMVIEKLV
jgi:hypothetical protein